MRSAIDYPTKGPAGQRGQLERLGEGPVGVCTLQQLLSDQLLKRGLESLLNDGFQRVYLLDEPYII